MSTENRRSRITTVAAARQQGLVVLEDIHDPHNAEAVFRSCDAFGIQELCIICEREKLFDPRKIGKQSSSSANKWLDFTFYDSTAECLTKLKSEGYTLLATVLADDAESIFRMRLSKAKFALMLGNENRGLSAQALRLADRRITIPMRGMVQSLNLSVTAAIMLYEITRQRIEGGLDKYLLPDTEIQRLTEDFLIR
jgi:tRNA (guanosine-2'-O-)-methyltransferase